MRNLLTIWKRELSTYFNSPIGYIFTFVFVALNLTLYQMEFFSNPSANMRSMFQYMPFIFCVFIPLVTMRLWSEERKENTIEMLLTFPMESYQLVLGKYFASVTFLFVSLFGTISIPVMLGALGNPDWGIIFSSYLGAFFLGSLLLSIGIFVSGLVKDQIVAAVISIAISFALYLTGIEAVIEHIDGFIYQLTGIDSSLGLILKSFLASTSHYEPFVKGIIPLASILYFVIWISLFLFLNGLFLEGRSRKGYNSLFAAACGLSLLIGLFSNYLLEGIALGRLDVTQDKIHTVSPTTAKIFDSLDGDLQIRYYVSRKEDLPGYLKSMEQQVHDKLEEMRISSGNKMRFSVVPMRASKLMEELQEEFQEKIMQMTQENREREKERVEKEESVEKSLMKNGVKPFEVPLGDASKDGTQLIFSCLGISYLANKEEFIPQVVPQTVEQLEYEIMKILDRQVHGKRKVAFVAPRTVIEMDLQTVLMARQMGQSLPPGEYDVLERLFEMEGFETERVDITKDSNIPKEFDILIIMEPQKLTARQRWEIARVLHNGKNVFLAVQNYKYKYRAGDRRLEINRKNVMPEVNDLLSHYGIKINDEVLLDQNSALIPERIENALNPEEVMMQQIHFPTQIVVKHETMNQKNPISRRINQLAYVWGSALDIDEEVLKENKLDHSVLMSSGDNSWLLPVNHVLDYSKDRTPPANARSYPLMVLVEGQFPDLYKADGVPEWPQQQPNPFSPQQQNQGPDIIREAQPAPGKLLLIGCANTFTQKFLSQDTVELISKSIDVLTSGDLADIRGRKIIPRSIQKISDNEVTFWKVFNYLVVNLIIILAGIFRLQWRRFTRDQYTMNAMNA